MANGFGSLYVGASGLQNAQNAINTTANNLANVDTKGYVRQQVRYADKNYTILKDSRANVNMQQSGLGVSIGDVVHARDNLIETANKMQSLNEQNMVLIQQAIEINEFDLTLFKSLRQAPETANYDKSAYNTGSLLGGGGFDATS